ncbi:hypothetical protein [Wenjunlia vitaminophila]|uniref:hypothetical protein n=1 Tax=Wenjunlia vitaminophila TaxID=76728 RepID=UPI0009964964|nr:hypothetical protein [Wenjunlia vitaminophila]
MLIEHLPAESATMTALRNSTPTEELERLGRTAEPERGRWSRLEDLVALGVDIQRQALHAFLLANHGKGPKPQAPDPIRRPGVSRKEQPKREPLSGADAERLFALING